MKWLLITVFSLMSVCAYANDEPEFVTKYNDWELYMQTDKENKVCFIVSSPIEKSGNYNRRDNSYLWVRYVSQNVDEVSVTPGYRYQNGTAAEMAIYSNKNFKDEEQNKILSKAKSGSCTTLNKDNHILDLIEQEQAWARETETDTKIIKMMKSGYYAVVTATSIKDTCSTDIYSLLGFTKAYRQMKSLCAE